MTAAKRTSISKIRKRNDEISDFNQEKITAAIKKAIEAVNFRSEVNIEKLSDEVVEELNQKFHERSIPAVEEIQDAVENVLINNKLYPVAKAFILYREQHARMRDLAELVNSNDLMDGYLSRLDWRVRENSNMAFSLQGLNNHVASAISSHYWLSKIYPPEVRDAHTSADIHLHDLQILAVYCCGWDLQDLLRRGFGGVEGKSQSKAPKHFRSALGQIVNFFYTLQGEAAGAQAFADFDTLLAPFIRYDNLSYKEVRQAMQEFVFNMNVPTRVGFQTPFTNLTFDLTPPKMLGDEYVIIGGLPQQDKYKDFQKEMDILNQAFAEVMLEGDARGRVFTFPIPTYNISKEFDWDNPVLNKIWEMTAKYGLPYFANFVNSDMSPDDARSMCCRLRLDNRELRSRGGGLFAANPLTGSIGVVTINLPRIGYISETKEEILNRVGRLMDISRKSLQIKREMLEKFTEAGLYPYARIYLSGIKERFGEYWRNHFNTIGVLGMNELLLNFLGKDISTPEGRDLALEIMDFMRHRLAEYQGEDNELYNLEATPGEGATYRFAKADKEKYPDIVVANEKAHQERGAAPYYTNSTHLPVNFTDDIFEAMDLQEPFQIKYTGGTVLHGFIGEKMPSIEATKNLVKKIALRYKLPYYTLTPTFSICPTHGYIAGEHFYCPTCDTEIGYAEEQVEKLPI